MPALEPYIIEPIWEQFEALLPERGTTNHPLGCHRSRVPDRVVFGKLVEVLVFGCAYWRIADETCSVRARCVVGATSGSRTLSDGDTQGDLPRSLRSSHRPRAGRPGGGRVHHQSPAPCGGEKAGRSPVDRGKGGGTKRSTVVDAKGIPLGTISAPANRHDSPLLEATLDTLGALGELPDRASVHLWTAATTRRLPARSWRPAACDGRDRREGQAGSLAGRETLGRGAHESSWHNAHKKLVWCTERCGGVIDFWVAFSDVVIIVRRLIREGWTRYRWESRPSRRP